MALNVFLILVAYVLGSIPSAVWIGKRFYGIDVREHGICPPGSRQGTSSDRPQKRGQPQQAPISPYA